MRWFSLGDSTPGHSVRYQARKAGNGVYLFVIDGEVEVGWRDTDKTRCHRYRDRAELDIKTLADSQLLLIDVPMA